MNITFIINRIKLEKGYTLLGLLALLLTIGAELSAPLILKYTLDEAIPSLSDHNGNISIILWLGLLYFLVGIANAIFTYMYTINFAKLGQNIVSRLRHECFTKIQRLPINYYNINGDGKIVSRITNDTKQVKNFFLIIFSVYFHGILYIFGVLIALYLLDPQLALITLCLLPIMVWVHYFRKYARRYNKEVFKLNSKMNMKLNEMLKNMVVIQVFNQEQTFKKRFKSINQAYLKYRKKILNLDSIYGANLVDGLKRFILFAIIVYFGTKRLDGVFVLTIGTYAVFYDYLMRLMKPIGNIFSNLEAIEKSNVCLQRIEEFLKEAEDEDGKEPIVDFKGNIEFRNIEFSYVQNKKVLKNINLKVGQGESIALVGHTGSGKTSMMNLLLRYYRADSGEIFLDGKEIQDIDDKSLRQKIGIIFQEPVIFEGTLRKNIKFENEQITDDQIKGILEEIGFDYILEKLSHGLDERLLEGGANLSFGERQLIGLARALVYDPKVLILDEATANIDTATEQYVQKALQKVAKNRTTIIIAHRLSTIQFVDTIFVLESGEIKEKGKHNHLLEKNGIYAEMYQGQNAS